MTTKIECEFSPPLPTQSKERVYLDTSVLIPLLLQRNNRLGRAIYKAIKIPGGKITSSRYVEYEFKRACLLPLWNLCRLIRVHRDIDLALVHLSQRFSSAGRNEKMMMQFTSELCRRIGQNTDWKHALNSIVDIALETERAIEESIEVFESNKIGCQLHKAKFDVNQSYDVAIGCKAECRISKMWEQQNTVTSQLAGLNPNGKSQKWWKSSRDLLMEVNNDANAAQNSKNCKALGDVVVALSGRRNSLLLTSDYAFLAIGSVTGQSVHVMNSIPKMLGGAPEKVAALESAIKMAANDFSVN